MALEWAEYSKADLGKSTSIPNCNCKVLEDDSALFLLPNYDSKSIEIKSKDSSYLISVIPNEYFDRSWIGWTGKKFPTPMNRNQQRAFSNYLNFLFLNTPFPATTFEGSNGQTFNNKVLQNRVSLLLFTMDRCLPCVWLEEEIHKLSNPYKSDSMVQFIAFNRDSTLKVLPEEFIQFNGAKNIMSEIPVFSYPTIYIVDRNQVIRVVEKGALPSFIPRLLGKLDDDIEALKLQAVGK